MRRSNYHRRAAAGLALALAFAAAVPAAAEPPGWSGVWFDALAGHLSSWWATTWGGEMAIASSATAASEASPNFDPDGVQPQPDGSQNFTSTEPTDEGDASPNIDPNG
jgi:hypothetical protein